MSDLKKTDGENVIVLGGNTLVTYIDGITGDLMLKDCNGNIAKLSDKLPASEGGGVANAFYVSDSIIQPTPTSEGVSGEVRVLGDNFFICISSGR